MSYILDALKKSEQERQQHQAPTVHSIYAAARPSATPASLSFRGVFLAVLLGGGVCAGAVWLAVENRWLSLTTSPPVAVAPQTAAEKNDAKEVAEKETAVKDGVVTVSKEKPIAVKTAVEPENASPAAVPVSNEVAVPAVLQPNDGEELLSPVPVNELPEAVRSSLPPMSYSFHVFSTDKARCTIIINSRRYREGELIANGWFLDSITESGIVVRKQRYRAAIQVVDTF